MLLSEGAEPVSGRLANGILGFRARTASVNLLVGIPKEAANAFLVDGPEDLVQGGLLGLEGLIPDRGGTHAIDYLQNPTRVTLNRTDQDLDGRPIPR
jgi:hypothetical protein